MLPAINRIADNFTYIEKPKSKAQEKRDQQAESLKWLREHIKPGDTIHTVLCHVSRSGMSRRIDLYKLIDGDRLFLTGCAADVLDRKWDRRSGGIVIGGCGMDMGFYLVYNLSYALFRDGFTCTGKRCPSNDHSNGDRNYRRHKHSDPGYALRHQWL